MPVARNRIRFIEIAFVSGGTPSNITGRETAPYGWIDGYLRRICNRGCRPGSLWLLGLGLPCLLGRLQRREILHQEPVSEDVTTTDLAQHMQFWAHMGHPCGKDFIGATFYKAHPEYAWQAKYLQNMLVYPWTLFSAKNSTATKLNLN